MKDENSSQTPQTKTSRPATPRSKILSVDVERFQNALDHSGMSDEEKAEYLQIIWSIVLEFVDTGYGIHPLQQSCGQAPQSGSSRPDPVADVVDCKDRLTAKTPTKTADDPAAKREVP